MTLTIHTEKDEQRQLKVTVEVAEERVQEQMRQTAREIGRGVNIPGFRRGKVPYNVLVQRIGPDALRSEAVEELLTPIFEETMAEIEEEPYAQPTLDDIQMEPLVIEFTVPLQPEAVLGDYRSIRLEKEPVEVTEEAVQEALEHVRSHHEVLEPVDRPVMEGDVVTLSGTGEVVEGESVEVVFDEERIELLMDPEVTFPGTDFVANVIGMEIGDEGEFSITFPEDEEEAEQVEGEEAGDEEAVGEEPPSVAGKTADFSVTILDVKSRYLPELDDELAQEEGDYETLDEMREALREQLREQAENEARDDFFDSFMEKMLEGAEIVYPPASVEQELDTMVSSMKDQVTRAGWEWKDYLMLQGQTEESMREEWRENAVNRVRRGLALRQLIDDEKLRLEADEIESQIEERLEDRFDDNDELKEQMRDFFRQGQGLEILSGELIMDKVYGRLEAIASGTAPSLEELEAAETEALDEEE